MFIIRHISIARTRKLPRYLTTILYILFAITIEFTKSNPLFAKENTYAKIIKCSPNEKREHCVIQLSKDINNILFNSQVLKVNFFHLGKIIFHIDPQFTKRINKKNLFHAKVFWQISNKEKEQMIRKNPSFSMRIKYKKISSLKPNTARQSFTPQKQESYIIYQFLSRNITSIAIIFFLIFIGYRIFKSNKASKKASKEYKNTIKKDLHLPHTLHPIINPYLCAGCGSCVKACPEGEIIKLINHKAVLVNPTKCVGHSLCATMCPYDAIDLVFGSKDKPKQIPLVSETTRPMSLDFISRESLAAWG
ncbi:MAG: ferredoxin family protein [Bdellovibrionota bacterium]